MTAHVELGGRTLTRAWRDGNQELVKALIVEWYRRSEAAAERHRKDPEFVAMIRERSHALADRPA